MNICGKVKDIIKTNDFKAFISLIELLKFTNCKSEAEIRSMFFACGMSPEKYDLLKQGNYSESKLNNKIENNNVSHKY